MFQIDALTMENYQWKFSPQEVFDNRKLFSNKIHTRVLKVIEEISTSFFKFEIVEGEGTELFLTTVNHFHHDLCSVIFQLRHVVIKIDGGNRIVCDLQNVITDLNITVLRIQEFLNLKAENLEIKLLEGILTNVGSQVENLMKIIEYDNLPEHLKILDCQLDLFMSIEALKLRNEFSYLSLLELVGIVHGVIDKIKNNLVQLKNGGKIVVENFSHIFRHIIQYLQSNIDYMREMNNTGNFQNDTTVAFKNADVLAMECIRNLFEAVRYDNSMDAMFNRIENCHKAVVNANVEIMRGFELTMTKDIDDKRVMQLFIHLYITAVIGLSVLNQSIEDAIIKE